MIDGGGDGTCLIEIQEPESKRSGVAREAFISIAAS